MSKKPEGYPAAFFAGGCFWCMESEFRALPGVLFTRVGYIGGQMEEPTYRAVTTGNTGHAEAVEVTFDPEKVSYKELVEFFLIKAHDPTQVDGQGVDLGTQYRSGIFTQDEEQMKIAQAVKAQVEADKIYPKPVVTVIEPAGTFWEGEEYHQQYYEKYEAENGMPHLRVLLKKEKNK
ncbi:MAG: peptide-methionine (S)-S-oxide reductase MsrA [Alphaproteobacteria bacterium]|nr:peptide-methionine (S)-S-oxide reductase MsrA [Alphaproteobacteria bacterium]